MKSISPGRRGLRKPNSEPGRPSELAGVIQDNIRSLADIRKEFQQKKGAQEKVADAITTLMGSMLFVYIHAAVFTFWLLWNSGALPGVWRWDPYPYVLMSLCMSVEAIVLTTFVLISQNQMAKMDHGRAELNLQISLLSEHEVTRLIGLVDAIADHLDIPPWRDETIEELKKDVAPEAVLQEIDDAEKQLDADHAAKAEG